jgi:cobalamin biosynthesis Co2+ chelatase CbiK
MELLKEFSQETTQALDAIQYKDFEQLIAQRGSFRVAFEDIMFSTKVALSSKDEFFKFVNQLIDNNFKTTAQYYLDGFNEYFKYDKQMVDLYDKLGKTEIDTNYKQ